MKRQLGGGCRCNGRGAKGGGQALQGESFRVTPSSLYLDDQPPS